MAVSYVILIVWQLRHKHDGSWREEKKVDIITGLQRQAVPYWLADLNNQDVLPLRQLLGNSLYYPSCGSDGRPVQYLAGMIYSFIYVDYGIDRDAVIRSLHDAHEGFMGYNMIHCRDVAKSELVPHGWDPIPPDYRDNKPDHYKEHIKEPFAIWSIHERDKSRGEDHGPERFSFLFICGDGTATYQALYHEHPFLPDVVAIIQPGHGFGCNWTDYTNPDLIFARSVLKHPFGIPKFLLSDGCMRGHEDNTCCWPEYATTPQSVAESGLYLWERKTDKIKATMKWDDDVKVRKTKLNCQNVLDILIREHPEYLRSNAASDSLFLEHIEQAIAIYMEYDELFEFNREIAEAALKRIPTGVISNPVSLVFIQHYHDAIDQLAYMRFIRETAEDSSGSAMRLNNRANAKAELGRIDEALEDYNLACQENPSSTSPQDITPFFGRAQLCLRIGLNPEALKDVEHIFGLLSASSCDNPSDHLSLARLFLQCNDPERSVICLNRLMKVLTDMLPFTYISADGSLEYEKGGHYVFALDSLSSEIIGLVKNIEESFGRNKNLIMLLETVKGDIALWRAKTGI